MISSAYYGNLEKHKLRNENRKRKLKKKGGKLKLLVICYEKNGVDRFDPEGLLDIFNSCYFDWVALSEPKFLCLSNYLKEILSALSSNQDFQLSLHAHVLVREARDGSFITSQHKLFKTCWNL